MIKSRAQHSRLGLEPKNMQAFPASLHKQSLQLPKSKKRQQVPKGPSLRKESKRGCHIITAVALRLVRLRRLFLTCNDITLAAVPISFNRFVPSPIGCRMGKPNGPVLHTGSGDARNGNKVFAWLGCADNCAAYACT